MLSFIFHQATPARPRFASGCSVFVTR